MGRTGPASQHVTLEPPMCQAGREVATVCTGSRDADRHRRQCAPEPHTRHTVQACGPDQETKGCRPLHTAAQGHGPLWTASQPH